MICSTEGEGKSLILSRLHSHRRTPEQLKTDVVQRIREYFKDKMMQPHVQGGLKGSVLNASAVDDEK